MKTKLLIFSVLISIILLSCKGEKGDIGPQGATGNQGNANVISEIKNITTWLTLSPGVYEASITDSAITQSIVDKGAVFAYQSNGIGGWIALPYTSNTSTGLTQTYSFIYFLNGITFIYARADQVATNPGTQTFKVIIMAGSIVRDNPFVDYNSYHEVKATFNLQE